MSDRIIYDFHLDNWTPDTLPMARLCQYLDKLAALFGSRESVHFDKVRKGSAIQQISVSKEAFDAVQGRCALLGDANAPRDIKRLQTDINRMLQDDKCVGVLKIKDGAVIYKFPGRKTPISEEITLHEFGQLDGEVIRVGGKDDSVPVWIQEADGNIFRCSTSKAIARELAKKLFSEPVRVSGNGKWRRTADRIWVLEEFDIKSWDPLDIDDIEDLIAKLRSIEGSGWNAMDNPQAELRKLRSDE